MSTKAERLARRKDEMMKKQKQKKAAEDEIKQASPESLKQQLGQLQARYNALDAQKPQKVDKEKMMVTSRDEPFKMKVKEFATKADEAKHREILDEQQRVSKQISKLRDVLNPKRVEARSRPPPQAIPTVVVRDGMKYRKDKYGYETYLGPIDGSGTLDQNRMMVWAAVVPGDDPMPRDEPMPRDDVAPAPAEKTKQYIVKHGIKHEKTPHGLLVLGPTDEPDTDPKVVMAMYGFHV